MKQYEVKIVADTNDGDYITEISKINEEKIQLLHKVVNIIKTKFTNNHSNWENSEYGNYDNDPKQVYKNDLTEDEIEWFDNLLPYGEIGIHTIVSIEYYELPEKVKLL